MHLRADRRAPVCGAARFRAARGLRQARQRSRPAHRRRRRDGQRRHRPSPGRDLRSAHLPRQQPVEVLCERRLRADQARLREEPLPALPARVRRRTLGRLRSAARGTAGPRGRAGPRDDEEAAAGGGGRAAASHRGGGQARAARAAGPEPAVRLRQHDGRQPRHAGRPAPEAGARGRGRAPRLGPLTAPSPTSGRRPSDSTPTGGISMRVLAALVLGVLGLWPSFAAAQTIKLGAVVPLTGRYGAGGAQVRSGYEIAVEQINAAGGGTVAGKKMPLELILLDDESDATKTVVIFQEKTDWGKEMATAWTEAGRAAGYTATVGEYSPGAKDFSDLILKAKAANADAVFALPTPPDGMTIVKQMKELGYTPKLALFIRAPDAIVWSKNLGKDGDWMVLAAGWHHAGKAPGVKELNDAHEKKYGRATDPISGPSYACVQIAAAAGAKTGSLDHAKVRDAIPPTDMTTVIGPVKFRPDGTGIVQQAFLQWQNGKQELVWPKEFATAPLAYPAPPFAKR